MSSEKEFAANLIKESNLGYLSVAYVFHEEN